MRSIVLVGGGGHCISILDALSRMNIYDKVFVTDPACEVGKKIMCATVAGNDDCLSDLYKEGVQDAFISLGSITETNLRRKLHTKLKTIGFNMPNIIDPSAVISEYATLGEGVFIGKNAIINAKAKIGSNAIINTSAVIEHECIVGEFTHVSVSSVMCGKAKVGNDSFIGANSTVIHEVSIGDRVVIGAGSVILKDVNDDMTVVGVYKGHNKKMQNY